MIFVVAAFNVFCIELLYAFVLNATLREFKLIVWYPLPLAAAVVVVYCAVCYFYSLPLLTFLDREAKGEKIETGLVKSVLGRSVNLPYFLGASFFALGNRVVSWLWYGRSP